MAQSLLSNVAVAALGRVVATVLGVLVTALLTRYLGSAGYGQYAVLIAFGTLVQLGADGGLYLTLSREITTASKKKSQLLSEVISLRLVLVSVLFMAGGALGILLVPTIQALPSAFLVIAIGFAFQSISQLLMSVYQQHSRMWPVALGDILGRLGQITAIVYLVHQQPTLLSVAIATAAGSALTYFIHYLYLPHGHAWRLTYAPTAWQALLRTSWPLWAMLVLNAIYFRIDAVLLSFFRPASEVGYYGLAYRLIESSLFFPAMFGGLLLPRLTEAWRRKDRAQGTRLLVESLQITLLITAVVLVVLLVVPASIVVFIAGENFRAAAPVLQVLALALTIMFFGNIFGFALVALEKQRVLLRLYALLAVGNIVANVLLIPYGGMMAAAWVTVITELCAASCAGIVVWRSLRFSIPPLVVVKVLVSSGLTAAILYYLQTYLPLLPLLCLTCLLYGTLHLAWRTLRRAQIALLLASPPPVNPLPHDAL